MYRVWEALVKSVAILPSEGVGGKHRSRRVMQAGGVAICGLSVRVGGGGGEAEKLDLWLGVEGRVFVSIFLHPPRLI